MMYKTVIGLEIHVEINTLSKMFSPGSIEKNTPPNTSVSSVDIALPGVLPTVNKEVIKRGIKLASALNCEIPDYLLFDRKNYFYPDLPKGYQITQSHSPIGTNGYLKIDTKNGEKKILIHDIHIEEDTANLNHISTKTLIDYNRAGIPLIEIVTEPCLSSLEEVQTFLETLRLTLIYLNVASADASKGEMRCDVNISLMKETDTELGVRTEVKNVSSLTGIKESIEYEIERHTKALDNNEELEQETRRYQESTHSTILMRKKVDAVDYKYFIEPNIPKIKIDDSFKENAIKEVCVLPYERMKKFMELGVLEKDAKSIIRDKEVCEYYEKCLNLGINAVNASNYVCMNILSYMNKVGKSINELYLIPEYVKEIDDLLTSNKINSSQAKELFVKVNELNKKPSELTKELGMEQITDEEEIRILVNKAMDENEDLVNSYKNGKTNILGAIVGKTIALSKGKANPMLVNKIVSIEIQKR